MTARYAILAAIALIGLAALHTPADAGIIDQDLPGTTQYDGWAELTSSNYGSHTAGSWPNPIGSNQKREAAYGESGNFDVDAAGDAVLSRLSGDSYPASGGFYSFNPTTLEVSDATPVAGLETVVFQLDIADGGFASGGMPTLSYNGGTQALTPNTSTVVAQRSETIQGFTFTANTRLTQWDLSGLPDSTTIRDFAIEWTIDPHNSVLGGQLNQSDSFAAAQTTVPTPSALALGLGGLGLMALRRRRRSGAAV